MLRNGKKRHNRMKWLPCIANLACEILTERNRTENLAGTHENDGQIHGQTDKSHHSAKHTQL